MVPPPLASSFRASSDTQSDLRADIIIIGAGMVGLVLALALGQAGVRVILVDQADPKHFINPPYDGRASALAYGPARMMMQLGLWEGINGLQNQACPIDDIRITDGESHSILHYDHRDLVSQSIQEETLQATPMGYIIENRWIRATLLTKINTLTNIHFLAPAQLVQHGQVNINPGSVTVHLADGGRLHASLLVGADGVNSIIRKQAGIRTYGYDYPQIGIVCTARFPEPHDNIAHERFLPGGPFALLPMTQERPTPQTTPYRASIVWTESTASAKTLLQLENRAFGAAMTDRFGPTLGPLLPAGQRWHYPLGVMMVERMIAPRLALIGDAAHQIHPIAGQGLNLGLRDAAALAEIIVEAMRLGSDPGSQTVLERYQRWRRFDILTLIAATDGLNRLFSNANPVLQLGRRLGLRLVEPITPLKRLFMRHARGALGRLPLLLRGLPL